MVLLECGRVVGMGSDYNSVGFFFFGPYTLGSNLSARLFICFCVCLFVC